MRRRPTRSRSTDHNRSRLSRSKELSAGTTTWERALPEGVGCTNSISLQNQPDLVRGRVCATGTRPAPLVPERLGSNLGDRFDHRSNSNSGQYPSARFSRTSSHASAYGPSPLGAGLNYHEAPVSLDGGRFDLSILMPGNHDEAMRRCAHCLVFLHVEPDRLDTRFVSTFAEKLPLLTRPEQRRGHLTHTFIDFSKEDLVAALLLLRVEIQRCPDLCSHRSTC